MARIRIAGYTRRDGTKVKGHFRTCHRGKSVRRKRGCVLAKSRRQKRDKRRRRR